MQPENNRRVYAGRLESYDAARLEPAVDRMLAAFGGVERLLRFGPRIVIKPNMLMAAAPDRAIATHPALVRAIAARLVAAGAQVTVAESPGGVYNERAFLSICESCGVAEAARQAGAELNRDMSSREVRCGERQLKLLTPVLDCDAVINLAKLKTHMMMHYTGAVKNLFGTVPGLAKKQAHADLPRKEDFADLLIDICLCVKPVFSVIDAVVAMEGDGPSSGTPRQMGWLLAGEDPFALDLAAMRLAGLHPQLSPVHKRAAERGLVGEETEWCGDPARSLHPPLRPPAKLRQLPGVLNCLPAALLVPLKRIAAHTPKVTGRCVGCGVCARACPAAAIRIRGGRARIDGALCIQCCCCHELCPSAAMEVE